MHLPHDAHRVGHPVPEVRVPEGDMLGAGLDLLGDVGEHDVPLHDPEPAVVDRDDRAVAAAVPAAAAGLGVAGESGAAVGHLELRVAFEARKTAAVGHPEPLPGQGHGWCRSPSPVAHEPGELRFELTPDHGHGAETAQKLGVGRGVEAEKAQLDVRVQAPDVGDDLDGEAGGGVHGHVERHEIGGGDGHLVEGRSREVDARHPGADLRQPRRRAGQPERLMPALVRGDKDDVHRLRACEKIVRRGSPGGR